MLKSSDSFFRSLSDALWSNPTSPAVYGILELNLDQMQSQASVLSHVTWSLARAFEANPSLNSIRRWGRVAQRKSLDFSVMVHHYDRTSGQADLTIVRIDEIDKLSSRQIEADLKAKSTQRRRDPQLGMSWVYSFVKWTPRWIKCILVRTYEFLVVELGVKPSLLFLPENPYGVAIVSNLQSFDVQTGLIPLVPTTRANMMVAIGRAHPRPVVVEGEVKVGRVIQVGFTFDHRFMDGFQAGKMIKAFKKAFYSKDN